MTPDVNVVLFDFQKQRGREMVIENEDGSYTVLINSRLSHRSQLDAYNHAMSHIQNNDFEKIDIQTIEAEAHKVKIPENAEVIPAAKYLERIKELQKERRKIQRQLRKYREDMEYLEKMGAGLDSFARGEYYKLYGNDL